MKKLLISVSVVILLLTVAGCGPGSGLQLKTPDATIQLNTPGPNPLANKSAENGRVAGILQGLWQTLTGHDIVSLHTLDSAKPSPEP